MSLSRVALLSSWTLLALTAQTRLGFVTQFGGNDSDSVSGMVRTADGRLFVAGNTASNDLPCTGFQRQPAASNLYTFETGQFRALRLPVGGTLQGVASRDSTIFAFTSSTLYRSLDAGESWKQVGANLVGADLRFITLTRDAVYMVVLVWGSDWRILRSTNNGDSFVHTTEGLHPQDTPVAVDPFDSSALLASFFDGVYRSGDRGEKWERIGPPATNLRFDPANRGVVYGFGENNRLVRSADSGRVWTYLPPPNLAGFSSVVPDPFRPGRLFGVTDHQGIYVSQDHGSSWRGLDSPEAVFALWIIADPTRRTYYMGTPKGLYQSRDPEGAWDRIGSPLVLPLVGRSSAVGQALFLHDRDLNGYVARFGRKGEFEACTYIGGSRRDNLVGIALDGAGNIVVVGDTNSFDFPSAPLPEREDLHAYVFVAKLTPDLRSLPLALVFRDIRPDASIGALISVTSFAVGNDGAVLVGGSSVDGGTCLSDSCFGGSPVATQLGRNPAPQITLPFPPPSASFVTRIDSAGHISMRKMWIGAPGTQGLAVDDDGNIYVAGAGAIGKIDPTGRSVWNSAIKDFNILGLALDRGDSLYVHGSIRSGETVLPSAQRLTAPRGPVLPGEMPPASIDGLVARLNRTSGQTEMAVLYGGEDFEAITSVGLRGSGRLLAAGTAVSKGLPTRAALQASYGKNSGFVTDFAGDFTSLLFATYAGDNRGFSPASVLEGIDSSVIVAGHNFFQYENDPLPDVFLAQYTHEPTARPQIDRIENTASRLMSSIAPLELVTVRGSDFGESGQVFLDGYAVAATRWSATEIDFVAPEHIHELRDLRVRVSTGGKESEDYTLPVDRRSPAIFTADTTGIGQAIAFNEDGSLNGKDHPAKPGSFITIAANGLGPADSGVSVTVAMANQRIDGLQWEPLAGEGIPVAVSGIRVRIPSDIGRSLLDDANSLPAQVALSIEIARQRSQFGVGIFLGQ